MQKFIKPVFKKSYLIGLLLLLSSCFDIVEEIDLNENGSGTYGITLNLSQSKIRLSSIMLLDSSQGYKVPKVFPPNAFFIAQCQPNIVAKQRAI